jgi:hypothetical protein
VQRRRRAGNGCADGAKLNRLGGTPYAEGCRLLCFYFNLFTQPLTVANHRIVENGYRQKENPARRPDFQES